MAKRKSSSKSAGDWVALQGEFTRADVAALAARGPIAKLSFTDRTTPLTEEIARGLRALESVDYVWLWVDTTRAALDHVLALPGLRTLCMSWLKPPGRLRGVAGAASLEEFRCSFGISAADVKALARSASLRTLSLQHARLTPLAIDALARMPALTTLDVEAARFDDAMAERLSASATLLHLECGGTRLTGTGLAALCRMKQLRSLDLWMTRIGEDDLDLLATLPNLEYVSLGAYRGQAGALRAKVVVPKLRAIKSLKRVWLDGIRVNDSTRRALEKRYAEVKIS